MNAILIYALQSVACSALFVLFYRAVLQGRTSFLAARRYLLASQFAAVVIPALDIPLWRVAPVEIPLVPAVFDTPSALPLSSPVPPAAPIDRASVVLWVLWAIGLAVFGVVMARQIVRIAAIRRRAEIHPADGFRVAVSGEVGPPFSFLGTVFIGRETPAGEMVHIVTHEASHIRHRHSAEKLAMEVSKGLQWFNPFAWWASRLLAEVHEFEADRDVLDGGSTVEEYLPLILRQTFGYIPELSVGLGDSLTKKRFLMMKSTIRPTGNSWLRVAGALPLAAGAMLLFSFTSRPPEIIFTEVPAPAAAPAEVAAEAPVAAPAAISVAEPTPAPAPAPEPAPEPRSPGTRQQEDPDPPVLIVDIDSLQARLRADTIIVRDSDLNSVKVVGYGMQRRSDAGVTGRSEAGIEIRGVGHGAFLPGSNAPLIILDGREISSEQLRALDPKTIQHISVIRDESATARYGERAIDGVVEITSNNNTFVWNAREKRPMTDADYTMKDGQKTIEGGIVVYTGDDIDDKLPAEVKTAMGGTRYNSVMVVTPR